MPAGRSGSLRSHSPHEPALTIKRRQPAGGGKRTAKHWLGVGGVGSHGYGTADGTCFEPLCSGVLTVIKAQ
ncbi:MAG: hypothetical protein ACRYFV_25410 [Janthinobacterium lividum]